MWQVSSLNTFSKHLLTMAVRATARPVFKNATSLFFGTGKMITDLKQEGTAHVERERLNVSVNTPDSCTANSLSFRPGMCGGNLFSFLFFFSKICFLTLLLDRTVKIITGNLGLDKGEDMQHRLDSNVGLYTFNLIYMVIQASEIFFYI